MSRDDRDGMTVRLACSADAPTIARLVNRAYRPSPSSAGWTHESALVEGDRTSPDQVRAMIRQADSSLLLLSADPKLQGCVYLQCEAGSAHIGMLAVDPEAQDAGLGKRLLAEAERHARECFGARRFVLTVVSARAELIDFYLRRGYHRAGGLASYPLGAGAGTPRVEGLMVEHLEKSVVDEGS
jgi:ribosomal protein S18 acetylase RimI-like enzyme